MQLYLVSASHIGRYGRLTSLGLYVMYAQAVQSVRSVESTVYIPKSSAVYAGGSLLCVSYSVQNFGSLSIGTSLYWIDNSNPLPLLAGIGRPSDKASDWAP